MTQKEKTKFRSSSTWKKFRKKLIEEREYTCEMCGAIRKAGLNVHHMDEGNYKSLNKKKFAVLCRSCHREVERILSRTKNVVDLDRYTRNLKRIVKRGREYNGTDGRWYKYGNR